MRIWVTGSGGLVGKALQRSLAGSGHSLYSLVRHTPARNDEIGWNPETGELNYDPGIAVPDAIVHLAGENIASGRWNAARKARIRDSRVIATDLLCKTLLAKKIVPGIFISASAIGIYGDRGDECLHEQSPPGKGFLAETCLQWEAASRQLESADCRVAHLRFGMILSSQGGALAKMLPIFRAGFGGKVGNGKQGVSWISLRDVAHAIGFVLNNPATRMALNVVSPEPKSNQYFATALGKVLHRPAILPAPAFAVRIAFGEMADALLLSSQWVVPQRLLDLGFQFEDPSLESALEWAIHQEPQG